MCVNFSVSLSMQTWWLTEVQTKLDNKEQSFEDFGCGIVVDARRAGLNISQAMIYWDFHTRPSQSLQRMVRKKRKYPESCCSLLQSTLTWSEGNGQITTWQKLMQITPHYDQMYTEDLVWLHNMRNIEMSIRPHCVPLLSTKIRKLKPPFTQDSLNFCVVMVLSCCWSCPSLYNCTALIL